MVDLVRSGRHPRIFKGGHALQTEGITPKNTKETEKVSMPAPTEESKYIQQHLANERTFLAWIRTVIAITGVGFVTTNLHFELTSGHHHYADVIVQVIGMVTVLVGFVAAVFCVRSYLIKRTGINTSSFRSTAAFAVFLSATIMLLLVIMMIYLLVAN